MLIKIKISRVSEHWLERSSLFLFCFRRLEFLFLSVYHSPTLWLLVCLWSLWHSVLTLSPLPSHSSSAQLDSWCFFAKFYVWCLKMACRITPKVPLQALTACDKDFSLKVSRVFIFNFFWLTRAFFIFDIQISTFKTLEPLFARTVRNGIFARSRTNYLLSFCRGGGRHIERANVEQPIFRNFEISNTKITKLKLFDFFIFKFW